MHCIKITAVHTNIFKFYTILKALSFSNHNTLSSNIKSVKEQLCDY